jgi:hypothetical protein
MAFFPQELLKCVTFVGYRDQNEQYNLAGSGFWVTRQDPCNARHRLAYFVTAAHVIDKVRESSADRRVWLRANTRDGGRTWQETPEICWKHHPTDPTVDLAVLKIAIPETLEHMAWPLESSILQDSLDTEQTGDRKVQLGDELCIAGLFHLHTGQKRNLPIVRIGTVAALREEPVPNRTGTPMDVYLVEAHSMGGLSGSPVFIDIANAKRMLPPSSGYMAAAYEPTSPFRFKLFGVIHGHFGVDTDLDAVADDGKQKLPVNFGIAMVIPAEKIAQVLAQFDEEERQASQNNNRPHIALDGGAGIGANATIGIIHNPPKRSSN